MASHFKWFYDDKDFKYDRDIKVNDELNELILLVEAYAEFIGFKRSEVHVCRWALYNALCRYSRDVLGFSRIKKAIKTYNIPDPIGQQLIETAQDVGIRIVSGDPYIHKAVAFLVYHFMVGKPFSISVDTVDDLHDDEGRVNDICTFNSQATILVARALLSQYRHKDKTNVGLDFNVDREFYRDLTYRGLTRSSLEAIMKHIIHDVNRKAKPVVDLHK